MKVNEKPLAELLFGVATSDHQCEAFDPDRQDIRDQWERKPGQTPRGTATNFWDRYPEDIGHAQKLGCKIFRFSIAWSRVESTEGQFQEEALAHYRELVARIRAAGMLPLITLHHFTWPLHVEQRGGLTAPGFPDWFSDYTGKVVATLGPGVPYWVTFNEPNLLVYGYIKPWWQADYPMPPGAPPDVDMGEQIDRVISLIRNLFSAHKMARDRIRQGDPKAMVGTNPFILGLPSWLQWLLDSLASHTTPNRFHRRHRFLAAPPSIYRGAETRNRANGKPPGFLAPVFRFIDGLIRSFAVVTTSVNSDWWHLGMAGKLPAFLCPVSCHGTQDFVGFDYYWGIGSLECHRISELLDASMSKYSNAPVEPAGLMRALKRFRRLFPGRPILVVENGCIESADGFTRAQYIQAHVRQVRAARRRRIPVAAYICWSITSNREWGLPFGPASDFGLYHIALDTDPTLARTHTPSVEVYSALIRGDSSVAN